jgi:hypothetical protein
MNSQPRDEFDDDGPWWRLDLTMGLILLIALAVLLIITSELWHSHFGAH